MSILLFHISDIHLKDSSVLKDASTVVACVQELTAAITDIFIVLTGDIAYSGLADQYAMVTAYLDNLSSSILKRTHLKPRVVVVPGNHDCRFPPDPAVRNLV